MGKIVKYCVTCEEGFAEKFAFCPNCAKELSAFEMKPVGNEFSDIKESISETVSENKIPETVESNKTVPFVADTKVDNVEKVEDTNDLNDEQVIFEPVNFSDESTNGHYETSELDSDDILEINVEEPVKNEEVFVAEDVPETVEYNEPIQSSSFIPNEFPTNSAPTYNYQAERNDNGYHVTVVSEKNGTVRNGLLLGAFALVMFAFMGLMVYSLFANLDDVASLNEDERLLALLNEEPMQTEEQEQKKDDEDGGGGGGGGTENSKPASKGELPTQVRNIIPPPPMAVKSLDDPSLVVRNATVGDNKRKRTGDVGLPNGVDGDMSGGRGRGGGFGNGVGTGFGNGNGTGEGNGDGSGSGNGKGNGNGDGTGDGSGRGPVGPPPPPPAAKPKPPAPSGVSSDIQILSKPKPGYTDAARQNNVTGVVRVKVTFLANGSIGGVSAVSTLPYGLTEKALAAARSIRFKPKMVNGVPQSVTKTVVFNFNIY